MTFLNWLVTSNTPSRIDKPLTQRPLYATLYNGWERKKSLEWKDKITISSWTVKCADLPNVKLYIFICLSSHSTEAELQDKSKQRWLTFSRSQDWQLHVNNIQYSHTLRNTRPINLVGGCWRWMKIVSDKQESSLRGQSLIFTDKPIIYFRMMQWWSFTHISTILKGIM